MAAQLPPTRLSSSLLLETRKLLINRPRTLTFNKINVDTGLTISWLNNFCSSKDDAEYGVNKIQTLYEYLSDKPLL